MSYGSARSVTRAGPRDSCSRIPRRVESESAAKVASSPVQGAGRLTFQYVRDPEGNLIEIQTWS